MKQSILAVFALALLGCSHAYISSKGPCPKVEEVEADFDLKRYVGKWFEYANFDKGNKCVKANYKQTGPKTVDWTITSVNEGTNKPSSVSGNDTLVEPGKFKSISPSRPSTNKPVNYWILATDYNRYSVGFFCQPGLNNTHISNAWIYTREREPSEEIVVITQEVLVKNYISLDKLVVANQKGC